MEHEATAAPTTPSTAGGPQQSSLAKNECDYDENPTVLYQAIEAKEWEYAIKLFSQNLCEGESGTWIIRKETNGKLRWRLLPLHAAIIFGSPVKLVECLLADYPAAAQCKDDRGMLPLHLAFRNEGGASWEIIEELVSVFPQAIFVKDRKGRTPLHCGIQLTQTSGASSNMSVSSGPQQSKTFKSIVTVLDLYSQVVISGERQRSQQEARKQVELKITQMQENHLKTLTTLKQEWKVQQMEAQKQIQRLQEDRQTLLARFKVQGESVENLKKSEVFLKEKLEEMSLARHQRKESKSFSDFGTELFTDDMLKVMVQRLLNEQREYHKKFKSMMERFERLAHERKQVLQIFKANEDSLVDDKSTRILVEDCQKWMKEKEAHLQRYGSSLAAVSNPQSRVDTSSDEKKFESDSR